LLRQREAKVLLLQQLGEQVARNSERWSWTIPFIWVIDVGKTMP
jgi:hypothetical protein